MSCEAEGLRGVKIGKNLVLLIKKMMAISIWQLSQKHPHKPASKNYI